ncbi:MAG TPA: AIM24 family protein [Steroidobacteraceae bacterium]|nr:AIM24 family protein [Steroidobacteraceae bacterium]
MATAPALKATTAQAETFAGVTYHVDGELVPVLTTELSSVPVYFEHHILLWKDTKTQIGVKSLSGAFKRVLSGMPVFMTEAHGPGRIAFSRDGVGHIFAMHLKQGQALDVREHQFLAATDQLDYTFARVKGVANMLMGGTGFFIDTFTAHRGDGIVWLHGYGNVFEVALSAGESIDIEPGGWVYKDRSVTMQTQFQKLSTGLFASAGQLTWNRFSGPGRVGIQSMYIHLGTTE